MLSKWLPINLLNNANKFVNNGVDLLLMLFSKSSYTVIAKSQVFIKEVFKTFPSEIKPV